MSAQAWLPWVVIAAVALLYFLSALTVATVGSRSSTLSAATRPANGDDDDAVDGRLTAAATFLARATQASALLAVGLAAISGFDGAVGDGPDSLLALVAAAAIAITGGALLQVLAATTAGRLNGGLRPIVRPVAATLSLVSAMPGISHVTKIAVAHARGEEEEVSATLQESLDLLEEARIPVPEGELRMIRGILRMDTVKVREIMRPRPDVVAAPCDSDPADIANLMSVGGYSKIPVYDATIDSIAGVVYARDLLNALGNDEPTRGMVKRLARPAIHVPESQSLERLLREFQEHRTSVAIVVDEYGGVSGLVTVTDLIEEIVGELVDEFDAEEPELQKVSDVETVADAGLSIDALNQALGVHLEAEGFDTVGGLVYRELGKMPSAGDRVIVDGVVITVQSTVGRRIRRVRVVKTTP